MRKLLTWFKRLNRYLIFQQFQKLSRLHLVLSNSAHTRNRILILWYDTFIVLWLLTEGKQTLYILNLGLVIIFVTCESKVYTACCDQILVITICLFCGKETPIFPVIRLFMCLASTTIHLQVATVMYTVRQ